MSYTVKDIITDAFDRTGIFPNISDALPGDMQSFGLKILKGLISHYNTESYLQPQQRRIELTISPTSNDNYTIVDNGSGVTISFKESGIYKVANITNCLLKHSDRCYKMKSVPFMIFDSYSRSTYTYCEVQNDNEKYQVVVKPCMLGKTMVVIYNEVIECELDTEYSLPLEYRELITLGLMLKLLTSYPRTDEIMKNDVKNELNALMANIKAKQANLKIPMYNVYGGASVWEEGNSGEFLFG